MRSIYDKNKQEVVGFVARNSPSTFLSIQFNAGYLPAPLVLKKLRRILHIYYRECLGRGWWRKKHLHLDFTGTIEHGATGCGTHAHLLVKTPLPITTLFQALNSISAKLRADIILLVRENGKNKKVQLQKEKYKTKLVLKSIFEEQGLGAYVVKDMGTFNDTSNIITHNMLFTQH